MEPQPKLNNKFAPEQSMSAEEWQRIHRPMDLVDETVRQVIEANNLECAKRIYEISKKESNGGKTKEMRFDAYSNSEITDAINSVISNKHDQYIIYSRLVCGKLWHDLFIFSKDSKRYYEKLCLKVYKKLEEKTNDDG